MKKILATLIVLLIVNTGYAQSKYNEGFNNGYKNGYCQDQSIGCIPPISPIAPIPKIGENLDSYKDGYNRGFKMGLEARITKKEKESSNSRKTYKTSKPEFIDYVSKPNFDLLLKIAQIEAETEPLRRKVYKEVYKIIVDAFNNGDYNKVIKLGINTIEFTKFYSDELYYFLGVSYYMTEKKLIAESYLRKASNLGNFKSEIMLGIIKKERGKIKISLTAGYEKTFDSEENNFYGGIILDTPLAYSKKWGILGEFLYSNNGPVILSRTNLSENLSSFYVNLSGYKKVSDKVKILGGLYSSFNFERESTNFGFVTGLKLDISNRIYIQGKFLKKFYEGYAFLDGNEIEINYPNNTVQIGIGFNLN
tara:strand:+ start:877 stop:1968 length:1092 start_codon:yes stop_codon:yes gene_type:complete